MTATNGNQTPEVNATAATNAAAVPGLIKELSALGENLGAEIDEQTRLELALKARTLWKALETPRETMIRHCWAQPAAMCALTAGVTKGIWEYLEEKNETTFKAAEVAKVKGIDPPVLSRLMRHLAAMGYLVEIDNDVYERTNFTRVMAVPIIGHGYSCISGGCLSALDFFHEWAEKNDWKTPNSISDGPYQLAFKTELNFFEYLQANPPYGVQFNSHMGGYHQGRPSWMDANFYPIKENLVEGFDNAEGSALIVDIGGSVGHDLEELHKKHPGLPGRLICQDLPIVIGQIQKLDDRIEPMSYDFYTEQPVKGARAYFMHSVLHDWPDATCLQILANITAAMKPGYSKVLINENVIPDTGAHWEATGLDIMMLTLLSSRERTRENWQDLLSKAGLKINNIYTARQGAESLIECELA